MADAIYLWPLTTEDIYEACLGWFRDHEVTAFLPAHLEASKIGNSYTTYAIIHTETGTDRLRHPYLIDGETCQAIPIAFSSPRYFPESAG